VRLEQSKDHYKRQYTIGVVEQSLYSALAMDTLGTSMSSKPIQERVEWFKDGRSTFPEHDENPFSFNTEITTILLDSLTYVVPVSKKSLTEYCNTLHATLIRYYQAIESENSQNKYYLLVNGYWDTGVPSPIGFTLGVYSAAMALPLEFLLDMVWHVSKTFGLCKIDQQNVRFYAVLAYHLAFEGYFGYSALNALFAADAVPKSAVAQVKAIQRNFGSVEILTKPDNLILDGLTDDQDKLLVELLLYLLRVSTAVKAGDFDSTPRGQLLRLLESHVMEIQDIGYLFGGYCLLSEHHCILLSKALMAQIPSRKFVAGMISAANNRVRFLEI